MKKLFSLLLVPIAMMYSSCCPNLSESFSFDNIQIKCNDTDIFGKFYPSTKSGELSFSNSEFVVMRGDTLGILVSEVNNNGFILYNTSGEYPLIVSDKSWEEFSSQPSYEVILSNYSKTHLDSLASGYLRETTEIVTTTEETSVSPLISVRWHQGSPFNWYSTNEITKCAGCVPIAVAQILSYYESPAQIALSFDGAPSSSISLDWEQIKENSYHDEPECPYCEQKAFVSSPNR